MGLSGSRDFIYTRDDIIAAGVTGAAATAGAAAGTGFDIGGFSGTAGVSFFLLKTPMR